MSSPSLRRSFRCSSSLGNVQLTNMNKTAGNSLDNSGPVRTLLDLVVCLWGDLHLLAEEVLLDRKTTVEGDYAEVSNTKQREGKESDDSRGTTITAPAMASFLILVKSIVGGLEGREQTEQQKLDIENNRSVPVGGQAAGSGSRQYWADLAEWK